jgi:hypothetical protein
VNDSLGPQFQKGKTHFMGHRSGERAACGKYIPAVHRPQDAARWSSNKDDVTCKGCKNRMQP